LATSKPPEPKAGLTLKWTRAITLEDVRRFGELSGDLGAHHLTPDAQGRLQAHGLLTATLPTKLGGDLNYVAHAMKFDFLRAVYSGDTLTCTGTVETAALRPTRWKVKFSFQVVNQAGEPVLTGTTAGHIPR
jgi:acyl dehydratase